jgi:hypothetical protein
MSPAFVHSAVGRDSAPASDMAFVPPIQVVASRFTLYQLMPLGYLNLPLWFRGRSVHVLLGGIECAA